MSNNWTYPKDLLKKIPPQHYIHVLNNNTNVVRVEVGPQTLLCNSEEVAVYGPEPMIVIPPRHYAIIEDPVICSVGENGERVVVIDESGQVKLRHGALEVRLEQDPFPLYPGERLRGRVSELMIVPHNEALKLECTDDVSTKIITQEGEEIQVEKPAGSKWLFYGPNTYIPQENVRIESTVQAIIVKPSEALKLEALFNFVDRQGIERVTGERWLYTEEGAFIPDIQEKIVEKINAYILTDKRGLHVEALHNFMDGEIMRHSGDRWLVTKEDYDEYIPNVHAVVVQQVNINTLTRRQWCTITHPYDPETNKNNYGAEKLVKGESNFFLHPYEEISPIRDVYVLVAERALLVAAKESFRDESGKTRKAGERWLEYGPKEYWPPVEVDILRTVNAFFSLGETFYLFRADAVALIAFLSIFVLILSYFLLF